MPRTVHYILTWLLFVGIYVANSIPKEGSLRVPAAIGGAAAVALLLLNLKHIRLQHFIWILAITGLCLFSLTLRAYTWPEVMIRNHLNEHIASWLVLVYAIVVSYSAYLELIKWDRDRIAQMFKVLILAIIVGAALEVFVPPFKDLSDTFRDTVFASGVYDGNVRDLYYYGAVRPKLFTSEPSHLAKYFALFSVAWLLITTQKQKYLKFFTYIVIGFFLIRSPIILIAPIIGFASLILERRVATSHKILLVVSLLAILLPMILLSAETVLIPRLQDIASGKDTSFIVRFLAPFKVMFSVVRDHPFLGLGFGAKEIGLNYAITAQSALNNSTFNPGFKGIGHNFLFTSVIQFGLVGFPVFVVLLWRLAVTFARGELFMIAIAMLGFMQTMGNPNSFRIWFFFFVLCAVVHVRNRSPRPDDLALSGSRQPTLEPGAPNFGRYGGAATPYP